ncbi:hypothetical protein [Enterobacter chuandaensis]|uniref:Uncharacterized protein n=1 Tax=Enterobacter chuandaensis TaxID=2497875 RepID=A0ABV5A7W7_9ENTR
MEKASNGFERILAIICLSGNVQNQQLRSAFQQSVGEGYIAKKVAQPYTYHAFDA